MGEFALLRCQTGSDIFARRDNLLVTTGIGPMPHFNLWRRTRRGQRRRLNAGMACQQGNDPDDDSEARPRAAANHQGQSDDQRSCHNALSTNVRGI